MAKPASPSSKTGIVINQQAEVPLYRQLYERLKNNILSGQLEADKRLPSTRSLANELGVSRNTTVLAYELLLMEGYIESQVGNGTRVARLQPEQLSQVKPAANPGTAKVAKPSQVAAIPTSSLANKVSQRTQLLEQTPRAAEVGLSDQPATRLFRAGEPDISYFPYQIWARLIAKHVRHSLPQMSLYQDGQGYAPLREIIAAHIGITRGVHCSPEQIILTAGAQGALDLVARVLLNPAEAAWVEEPGYGGARGPLLAAGARLVPVPVDHEGLEVEMGRQLCPEARLAVVTPSHQFPTGVTMSLSRRLALLEWSREANAWIIEDDYDSEYRFSGRPLEALQSFDTAQRVIYIGTFSKVLFPALRLGYLVVPPELVKGFLATRSFTDLHLPILEQLALTDFIAEGHYTRHLKKMRVLYLERRNTLVETLRHELGTIIEVTPPEAGMHLVAWLPVGFHLAGQTISQEAAKHGIHVTPIAQSNSSISAREGLMLGFSSASSKELQRGVQILATILKSAN